MIVEDGANAENCCEDIFYDYTEEEIESFAPSIKRAWEFGRGIAIISIKNKECEKRDITNIMKELQRWVEDNK